MKFPAKLTALFSGIFLVIGSITSYLVYTSNLKILEKEIKDTLEVRHFIRWIRLIECYLKDLLI